MFTNDKVLNVRISWHYLLVICEGFSYLHSLQKLKDARKFETAPNLKGYGDLVEVEGVPKVVLPSKSANSFKLIIDKDEKDVNVGKSGVGYL